MNGIYDEKTKLWGSVDQKQSQGPTIPLGQVILNWLSSHGSRVAQVSNNRITFPFKLRYVKEFFRSMMIMELK